MTPDAPRVEPPAKREGRSADPSSALLAEHLHLVYRVVGQLARRLPANVEREDLLSAGIFGLAVALRRNGGADGATFQWYARTRIRGAVFDELRAQDWLSRRARDRLTAERGDGCGAAFVSFEDAGFDHEGCTPAEALDPAALAEAESDRRALGRAMTLLPERERHVVTMHYFEGRKLKEIGAALGVSEPRVSQLHARALEQLRAILARDAA